MKKVMMQYQKTLLTFLIVLVAGCGTNDFNQELGQIHRGGPNCTQSSCHGGFRLSGTIFELIDSETPAPGKPLWVIPPVGLEYAVNSDGLGNFWEAGINLEGDFLFRVGETLSTSGNHPMPERSACNTCHVALGSSAIAVGRIF